MEQHTRGAKGILEFPLPEEENRFQLAVKSLDFALAWHDLEQWIRKEIKYSEHTDDEHILLERFRDAVANIKTDYELPDAE